MLSGGSLDDRVVFLRAAVSRNDYGEQVTEWAEAYRCHARVVFKKGEKALSDGEVWLPHTIAVTIRWTPRVDERMRLRWDGKEYAIESLNGTCREGQLVMTASRVEKEEKP